MADSVNAPQGQFTSMMMYVASSHEYHFKMTENAPLVVIPESRADELLASVPLDTERDLLKFLLDESRKAPGRWTEASNRPVVKGQALI